LPELRRGDIWITELDPTRGHEQAGIRPALIISEDNFNRSGAELVFVIPITSQLKRVRYHVLATPPDGGLPKPSHIKCEDMRAVSHERLVRRLGKLSDSAMEEVERKLRLLIGL